MKILLAATPMTSHVGALLNAGRLLRDAGHDVLLTTAAAYAPQALAAGIPCHRQAPAICPDLDQLGLALPQRLAHAQGPARLLYDLSRILLDTAPAQSAALAELLQRFPADLVLHDTLYGGALPMLLKGRPGRPTVACLGTTVLPLARADGGATGLGLPPATSGAQAALYRVIGQDIDANFSAPLQARANAMLARLGCPALPCALLDALVRLPDLYLQPSVPSFEFPSAAPPPTLHFIGALTAPAEDDVPGALALALAQRKRVVLVSQNCGADADPAQLIGPAVAALAGRRDLQLLVTARSVPLDPATLPCDVHPVPHSALAAILPYVDVLLANGGHDVVTHALSLGVPVVCAGLGESKPEVAARVAWTGAGLNLLTDRPSPLQLRDAVDQALDHPAYRGRAQDLAFEFEHYDAALALPRLLSAAVQRRSGQPEPELMA